MRNEYFLMLATPFSAGAPTPFSQFSYIPIQCTQEELSMAVSMASEKNDMQILGVISEEMISGMAATLAAFKKENP